MDLKQLRQFYEVCERGSFSRAGESLYMTQQAIGKSMRLLEEDLGVVLFIRDKSGVTLTPQGEYLKGRCRHLFEYVKETEKMIQQMGADCPLQTRVAVMEGVAEHVNLYPDTLVPVLYHTPFIETVVLEEEACEQAVCSGAAGAAVVSFPTEQEGLLIYPLLHLSLCAVAQKFAAEKKELTLRDFRQKKLILLEKYGRSNSRFLHALREQNLKPDQVFFAASFEEGFALSRKTGGIFIMPENDFKLLRPEGLREIPIKNRSFSLNFFYIFRKEDNCQRELQRVYEYLKTNFLL